MKTCLLTLIILCSLNLFADDDGKEPLVTVGFMNIRGKELWDYNNDDQVDFEVWTNSAVDAGSTVFLADTDFDGYYDEKTTWSERFAGGTVKQEKVKEAVHPMRKLNKINIPQSKVRLKEGPYLKTKYGKLRIFPGNNHWNLEVSNADVHPNSDNFIKSIGADKPLHPDFGTMWKGNPNGIPFIVIPHNQKRVPVTFKYADESDRGPYPIPPDAPIEGGPDAEGDRHIIVLDYHRKKLYEVFSAYKDGKGWKCGSGAIFDLSSNKLRPAGWTSADAAGLPIFPGLVRFDEVVEQKEIKHALRFTVRKSQRAYIYPARHFASKHKDKNLPPMGLRFRLKRDFDISRFPPQAKVIATALKKYGMIVADNGGDWFISGAPNQKWNHDDLRFLKKIKGKDLEAVYTGETVTK